MWWQTLVSLVLVLEVTIAADTDGQQWWKDAIYYRLFVDSFKDTDGDGIGDLGGKVILEINIDICVRSNCRGRF